MKFHEVREINSVQVFKQDAFAGTLSRTSHGARFVYDPAFVKTNEGRAFGIAVTLPLQNISYEITGSNLHPFFAGLLPEGLRLKALRQNLKTSEDDLFSMLVALGSNCIGDVYVRPEVSAEDPIGPQAFNTVSFLTLFNESVSSSDFATRERDSGIPGIMPKLSGSMISFPVQIAAKRKQYLLKLETEEHPRLVANEHFFMQMAADCGFRVPKTAVVKDKDGISGLLVERFDRTFDKEKKEFIKVHQEDACQFLDRYPQDKYRLSMAEIARGIAAFCSSPLIDTRTLLEMYLFNYLIGNGDFHAKNISLNVWEGNRVALSPFYDVVSTLPYGDRTMALKLGAKDDNFSADDFIGFGEQFGVRPKAMWVSIFRLTAKLESWISRIYEIGLGEKKSRDLEQTYKSRANKIIATLGKAP